MGWAYSEIDGRPVGYSVQATCDQAGCATKIDRGLAYACGGEHGSTPWSCGGYFCAEHRQGWSYDERGRSVNVCNQCDAPHDEEDDA